jgi:hypothetical protein
MPLLAAGQVWRVAGLNLQVTRVGPLLVDYKIAKPDAIRIPSKMSTKATIGVYLKKNKAVLVQG